VIHHPGDVLFAFRQRQEVHPRHFFAEGADVEIVFDPPEVRFHLGGKPIRAA
jgi:hypothetical protein